MIVLLDACHIIDETRGLKRSLPYTVYSSFTTTDSISILSSGDGNVRQPLCSLEHGMYFVSLDSVSGSVQSTDAL